MLYEYHTLHGAEHMRTLHNPKECAACGERTAYHECTTCGVALHSLYGKKVWRNCHAKYHDPVFDGQLWCDKHKRRGGGTKRAQFSEPDARATAAALKRVRLAIANELAADDVVEVE